jgi:hypothetical protein
MLLIYDYLGWQNGGYEELSISILYISEHFKFLQNLLLL